MTTPVQNLEQYIDKKVLVTVTTDEGSEQIEGKVEMGNALGLLFKPKGKAQPILLEASKITAVDAAPDKPKVLKAKTLKEVAADSVRSHLLERHGVDLDWANAATDENAAAYHDGLDHAAAKLGHVHKTEDEATEREAAIADAEADAAE